MKFRPIGVCWPITSRCNYNCPFCYADKLTKELDINDRLKIIDTLSDNGVKFINFTGGEPLLVKHFNRMIVHAKNRGIFTDICSNGSLMTPTFVDAVKDHLDQISFPIDGSTDKVQQQVRGQKNHLYFFRRAVDLISRTNIKLKINTLVCNANRDDLNNIYNILCSIPRLKKWKLIRYYPVNRYDKRYELSPLQFRKITDKILRLESPFEIVPKYQADGYQSSFIIINPNGDVLITYKNTRLCLGNILKDNFKDILEKAPKLNKDGHMKKYYEFMD